MGWNREGLSWSCPIRNTCFCFLLQNRCATMYTNEYTPDVFRLSSPDSPCWSELTSINKKQATEKLPGESPTYTLTSLSLWPLTSTTPDLYNLWPLNPWPLGQYLPVCDAEGYYRSHQCHGSSGQCWCVDRYGNEVAGSRTHGAADCGRSALSILGGNHFQLTNWFDADKKLIVTWLIDWLTDWLTGLGVGWPTDNLN